MVPPEPVWRLSLREEEVDQSQQPVLSVREGRQAMAYARYPVLFRKLCLCLPWRT